MQLTIYTLCEQFENASLTETPGKCFIPIGTGQRKARKLTLISQDAKETSWLNSIAPI